MNKLKIARPFGKMGRRKQAASEMVRDAASTAANGQHTDDASFTESYTAEDFARDQAQLAQRDPLAAVQSGLAVSPPTALGDAAADEQLGWCSVQGVFAGLSGGALGYAFGFVPKLVTHKGKGRLGAAGGSGISTAKSFAIMGGIYAAVSCWSVRIRQKRDAYNAALAGGVTGMVLAWGGSPSAMLQSAVGFAAFSYVMDKFQPEQEAHAATGRPAQAQQRSLSSRRHGCGGGSGAEAPPELAGQRQALLDACKAADCFLLPLQAAITPAAAMLRPLVSMLAPCSVAAAPGACRRGPPLNRQQRA